MKFNWFSHNSNPLSYKFRENCLRTFCKILFTDKQTDRHC